MLHASSEASRDRAPSLASFRDAPRARSNALRRLLEVGEAFYADLMVRKSILPTIATWPPRRGHLRRPLRRRRNVGVLQSTASPTGTTNERSSSSTRWPSPGAGRVPLSALRRRRTPIMICSGSKFARPGRRCGALGELAGGMAHQSTMPCAGCWASWNRAASMALTPVRRITSIGPHLLAARSAHGPPRSGFARQTYSGMVFQTLHFNARGPQTVERLRHR